MDAARPKWSSMALVAGGWALGGGEANCVLSSAAADDAWSAVLCEVPCCATRPELAVKRLES